MKNISININKLECKVFKNYNILIDGKSININKLECKE